MKPKTNPQPPSHANRRSKRNLRALASAVWAGLAVPASSEEVNPRPREVSWLFGCFRTGCQTQQTTAALDAEISLCALPVVG